MMKRFSWSIALLLLLSFLLTGCSVQSVQEQSVDLTGKWYMKGYQRYTFYLVATIDDTTVKVEQKGAGTNKVMWSGSYEAAKGSPASFVSRNDYRYTRYAGTISTPTLTFYYQDGVLSFTYKPAMGKESTVEMTRK